MVGEDGCVTDRDRATADVTPEGGSFDRSTVSLALVIGSFMCIYYSVNFWYPTEVTRPYMPDPAGLAQAIITMLENVGFVVTPNSSVWGTEYIPAATGEGAYEMHFLGWTGDYDDPWNWYGYHFDLQDGEPPVQFNCDPEGLRDAFATANSSFDEASRGAAFAEVARLIHENACFVTLIHGDTALAFKPQVQGYVPAPTGSESFKSVWLSQDQ